MNNLHQAKQELTDIIKTARLPFTVKQKLMGVISRIESRADYRLALHMTQAAIQRAIGELR